VKENSGVAMQCHRWHRNGISAKYVKKGEEEAAAIWPG
jgi:hypothetical protein